MSVIEVKNLIKTYQSGDTSFNALDDVSLSIELGEMVAIMGPSGSGKSTFMNMVGCLDKPTSGQYFLDGADVSILNSDELAEIRNLKLGFVFQGFNLISKTSALENVELPMIYKGINPVDRKNKNPERQIIPSKNNAKTPANSLYSAPSEHKINGHEFEIISNKVIFSSLKNYFEKSKKKLQTL